MEKLAESSDKKVPFMIGIKGGLNTSITNGESNERCEMKLTIFYSDIDQNRKFLICTLKCSNLIGRFIDEIKVSFDGFEKTNKVSIPKSVEIGDFIAYLRHSIIPNKRAEELEDSMNYSNDQFIYENATESNQKYLQVMDSSSTIFDLINRPLDKGVIMIRDKQNLLRALVSKVELGSQHNDFTESYALIEKISIEINVLLQSGLVECLFTENIENFDRSNEWVLNQKWKTYIDFFEKPEMIIQMKPLFDTKLFLDMLKEIKRIATLLHINNQVFLSEKDKTILRDSFVFFRLLKELKK